MTNFTLTIDDHKITFAILHLGSKYMTLEYDMSLNLMKQIVHRDFSKSINESICENLEQSNYFIKDKVIHDLTIRKQYFYNLSLNIHRSNKITFTIFHYTGEYLVAFVYDVSLKLTELCPYGEFRTSMIPSMCKELEQSNYFIKDNVIHDLKNENYKEKHKDHYDEEYDEFYDEFYNRYDDDDEDDDDGDDESG